MQKMRCLYFNIAKNMLRLFYPLKLEKYHKNTCIPFIPRESSMLGNDETYVIQGCIDTKEICHYEYNYYKCTPKYGTLLSRHWGNYVGLNIQCDLSYATIPIFGGDTR